MSVILAVLNVIWMILSPSRHQITHSHSLLCLVKLDYDRGGGGGGDRGH